jgi:hypothetical protein
MAIGPIDYMGGMPQVNLAQQFTQGLQAGAAVEQLQVARQQREAQMQAAEEARMRQEQFRLDFADYVQKPTVQKWAALSVANPQMREVLGDVNKTLSADQARVEQREALELFTALERDPAVAAQLVDSRIEAARNTGQPTDELEAIRAQVQTNPALVRALALGRAASLPDGDKAISAILAAEAAPLSRRKAGADAAIAEAEAAVAPQAAQLGLDEKVWNISDKKSQIEDRAARLNFDADKAFSEYQARLAERGEAASKLPESAITIINNAALASAVAEQAAGSMESLASEFDKLGGGYGPFSSAAEAMKKLTGNEGAVTAARQEYLRLRNTAVVKSLPPGPATDRDIALFMQGFPAETADASYLASFLRGMAKIQRREAVVETAKADWAEANGGLLRNKKDTTIAGVRVPAGARFESFVQQFAERKASERKAESDIGSLKTRPYMRWATPGAGQ